MHIAVAGNIGAGKTTLTRLLAKHFKWEPHFEDVVDNPYLDDFYHQMERWSFNLQIYFLNSRFRQVLQIRESGKNIIQDRTIYEDSHIFAPNLHAMGLMTNRDFNNYKSLFELMESLVEAPDLLIYLRSSIPNLENKKVDVQGWGDVTVANAMIAECTERFDALDDAKKASFSIRY